MQDTKPSVAALKTGAWVALLTTLLLFYFGHSDWAWGFLIGAFISLFSLFSLSIVIPMLFQPGASPHVRGLLGMTLYMKLPIYGVLLYLAASVKGITPMAVGLGMALSPMVITARTIGDKLTASLRIRWARRSQEPQTARLAPTVTAEPVHERG